MSNDADRNRRPNDVFEEVVRLRREGRRGVLCTIVRTSGSTPAKLPAKMLVREDGTFVGTVGGGCVEAEVWTLAQEVLETGETRTAEFRLNHDEADDTGLICGGTVEIFLEPVSVPVCRIFGGGHLGRKIALAAAAADFRTAVWDDRERFAHPERFPDAERLACPVDAIGEHWTPGPEDHLAIVTRGHALDKDVLRWAAGTDAGYIGMIGSRAKVRRTMDALAEEGVDREALDRVHAPIGLDIGAVTPGEIAVAVVAEMIRHRRGGPRHPTPERRAPSASESA